MPCMVLKFDDDSAERLEKMGNISGVSDISEVMQDALQVYEYLLERVDEGCTFTMAKPGCGPEPLEIFAKEEDQCPPKQ